MNSHVNLRQHRATSYTPRFAVPAIVAWAMAGLTGTPVRANPTYVSAFATVSRPSTGPLTQDTSQLIGQTATTAEVSFNDLGQNSTAQVRAEMSHLGVRVFAGSAGATAGAVAVGIAKFSDELRITSATLPSGTPVALQFSMQLEGTTVFDTFSSLPGTTGLDSSLFLIGQVSGTSHVYHELHRFGYATALTGDKTFTVNSTIGATLTLVGTLDINARSDFRALANSAHSDYLSSARFIATPDDPEVSVIGASGHDYAAVAVPEPAQYGLIFGAVVGLIGFNRRCRGLA